MKMKCPKCKETTDSHHWCGIKFKNGKVKYGCPVCGKYHTRAKDFKTGDYGERVR